MVTGIKPTGTPHIGNYLGMIRPTLEFARRYRTFIFIADYHALTTMRNGEELRRTIRIMAATWLALGLDPEKVVFYRQSQVPAVYEMAWILSCFTAKGLLNRAHAYKSAVEENLAAGRRAEDSITAGVYNYPVLMAADILLLGADYVPVGRDQKQHVEIARDVAAAFNSVYRPALKPPEALIGRDGVLPGTDGRKMSKKYNNTIPIFAEPDETRRRVRRIVTDSARPEDPKDPETSALFAIYRGFAVPEAAEQMRRRFLEGGLAYGALKEEIITLLDREFGGARRVYRELLDDPSRAESVLLRGAARAREAAAPLLSQVRRAIGVD